MCARPGVAAMADLLTGPGTITQAQRLALIGALDDAGIKNTWQRAARIGEILAEKDWLHGGDLGWLSEAQAATVLDTLTAVPEPGELSHGPAWDAP